MNQGYVKLYRKVKTCACIEHDLKALGFFSWLLVHVNWETKTWKGEIVEPGEMITSIKKLSEKINESEKVTRRLIRVLKTEGILEVKPRANKWTKLKLCNWATYQTLPDAQGRTDGQTEVYTKGGQLKNKEIKNNNISPLGSFENVFLSKEEIQFLIKGDNTFCGFGSSENLQLGIDVLSAYINDKQKYYDNFVNPMKTWVYHDIMRPKPEKKGKSHAWNR